MRNTGHPQTANGTCRGGIFFRRRAGRDCQTDNIDNGGLKVTVQVQLARAVGQGQTHVVLVRWCKTRRYGSRPSAGFKAGGSGTLNCFRFQIDNVGTSSKRIGGLGLCMAFPEAISGVVKNCFCSTEFRAVWEIGGITGKHKPGAVQWKMGEWGGRGWKPANGETRLSIRWVVADFLGDAGGWCLRRDAIFASQTGILHSALADFDARRREFSWAGCQSRPRLIPPRPGFQVQNTGPPSQLGANRQTSPFYNQALNRVRSGAKYGGPEFFGTGKYVAFNFSLRFTPCGCRWEGTSKCYTLRFGFTRIYADKNTWVRCLPDFNYGARSFVDFSSLACGGRYARSLPTIAGKLRLLLRRGLKWARKASGVAGSRIRFKKPLHGTGTYSG